MNINPLYYLLFEGGIGDAVNNQVNDMGKMDKAKMLWDNNKTLNMGQEKMHANAQTSARQMAAIRLREMRKNNPEMARQMFRDANNKTLTGQQKQQVNSGVQKAVGWDPNRWKQSMNQAREMHGRGQTKTDSAGQNIDAMNKARGWINKGKKAIEYGKKVPGLNSVIKKGTTLAAKTSLGGAAQMAGNTAARYSAMNPMALGAIGTAGSIAAPLALGAVGVHQGIKKLNDTHTAVGLFRGGNSTYSSPLKQNSNSSS